MNWVHKVLVDTDLQVNLVLKLNNFLIDLAKQTGRPNFLLGIGVHKVKALPCIPSGQRQFGI